ncbi:MAG: hypothetical protein QGH40_03635 [bacterium]|jgi:hypothetical protein|nr:hypothetical protein [bacterium]
MVPLKDILIDVLDELFMDITPESAQRDIEDLLKMRPSDPDYHLYFSL